MHPLGNASFVVLPDVDRGRSIGATLRAQTPQVVEYGAGRPWIVRQWPAEDMTLAVVGPVRAAVIGCCAIDASQLVCLIKDVREVADFDQLARRIAGSFHLVASVAGEVRVQGSVSAVRRVYYARVAGITIAADNTQVLAPLAGVTIDINAVALRLAYPQLPDPLDDQSLWHGVQNLPPDCYLVLNNDGYVRMRRWWSPPEPVLPLTEGAVGVRQELMDAVAIRTAGGGVISTDLSGGIDSTSLCFLAARETTKLLTVRRVEVDPGSDDDLWARRAATRLAGAEHLVFAHNEAPPIYADIANAEEHVDGPYRWIRTRGRHVHLVELLAKRGCRQHLTGHGGDELFGAFPSYLHTLMRVHPWIATRHVRGFQALRRWPWQDTMHALTDRTTFAGWLAAGADRLSDPPPAPTTPHLGWGWPVRMPPWATRGAVEAVRDLFTRAAAEMPVPLADSRAQHEAVQYIRTCGRAVRQVAALASAAGTRLAAPYLDDRVIEAALAVRLHERMTPWQYKPLLATAMHGVVPGEILGRTTKGDFTADVYVGLKQNREHLLELFDDSVLANHGLINPTILRKAILGLHPTFGTLIPLELTVACEIWLRAASSIPSHSHEVSPCH